MGAFIYRGSMRFAGAAGLSVVTTMLVLACVGDDPDLKLPAESADAASVTDARSDDAAVQPPPSRYRQLVLQDDPAGYWRLGETGGIARDESPARRDLVLSGSCTFGAPGAIVADEDPGVSFDGATCLTSVDIRLDQQMSLEAWIKPRVVDSSYRMIFHYETGSWNSRQGVGVFLRNGEVVWERWVDGAQRIAKTAAPPAGAYAHLVAVFDGQTLSLYLNGSPLDVPDDRPMKATAPRLFMAGSVPGWDLDSFAGALDEVAVYAHALTAEQIRRHYDVGLQTAP